MACVRTNRLIIVYPNGRQIVVMWHKADKVVHIKRRIESKTSVPCEQQILLKRGASEPLIDEQLLAGSNVRDEDVAVLSVAQTSAYQVFVKGRNGKNTVLWVNSLDTVDGIKHKIELKDGVPFKEQRLVFNGREMLGNRSMSDYRVKKNNTLFLVLRLRGGMTEDRILTIEDRLAEIELNYATDNYVDERDQVIHNEIEEEVAILHTSIGTLSEQVVTFISATDANTLAIASINAGRMTTAITSQGGTAQQTAGLAIAAIQMQHRVQEDNERLSEWVTESMMVTSRARDESAANYGRLRGEVVRLTAENANMQSQLAVLETRFNHLVRRGPYTETPPAARPRLPPTFVPAAPAPAWLGLRGGGQLFVKGLNGQTMVLDDVNQWTSILEVKKLILRKLGYIFTQPPDLRLVFGGRNLHDEMCLCDYNIVANNTIFLIFRLRGGMDAGALVIAIT